MSRHREAVVVAVAALAAVAFCLPTLAHPGATGGGDWPQFHHWWEATRIAIAEGELPLWDPFHCGGVTLWGQPQSMHAAPTYWVTGLLFGTALGSKLFVLLHALVGVLGVYAYGRQRRALSPRGALLAAVTWGLGGFFAHRVAEGHATFYALHYLPWVLLAFHRATRDPRFVAALAALLALILAEGGTYALPFTLLALLYEAATVGERSRRRSAAAVAGALGLFGLIGAARLWPIAITLRRFARPTELLDHQSPLELGAALVRRAAPEVWTHPWSYAEHAAHVGVVAVALALFGATLARRDRRARRLLIGGLLFSALALGDHGPASPWSLLHSLPGFSQLHVPSRFMGVATFYVALLGGVGLDRASTWMDRRAPVSLIVVAVGLVEVLSASVGVAGPWRGPPLDTAREAHHHLVTGEDYLAWFMRYPARGVGTASCYDPIPWDIPAGLWEGDVAQARVVPAGSGVILGERRTSGTYRARVALRRPATVVINQRFDPDWRSDTGRTHARAGLLAVAVPPGEHDLRMRYRPRDLPWSLLVSLLGLLAAAWVGTRRARNSAKAGPS